MSSGRKIEAIVSEIIIAGTYVLILYVSTSLIGSYNGKIENSPCFFKEKWFSSLSQKVAFISLLTLRDQVLLHYY